MATITEELIWEVQKKVAHLSDSEVLEFKHYFFTKFYMLNDTATASDDDPYFTAYRCLVQVNNRRQR